MNRLFGWMSSTSSSGGEEGDGAVAVAVGMDATTFDDAAATTTTNTNNISSDNDNNNDNTENIESNKKSKTAVHGVDNDGTKSGTSSMVEDDVDVVRESRDLVDHDDIYSCDDPSVLISAMEEGNALTTEEEANNEIEKKDDLENEELNRDASIGERDIRREGNNAPLSDTNKTAEIDPKHDIETADIRSSDVDSESLAIQEVVMKQDSDKTDKEGASVGFDPTNTATNDNDNDNPTDFRPDELGMDQIIDDEPEEIDDSFPKAREFLADEVIAKAKRIKNGNGTQQKNNNDDDQDDNDNNNDCITLAEQANEIVAGFNGSNNNSQIMMMDGDNNDNNDDARTISTQRTTRVQPVSAAFRIASQEDVKKKWNHPHQSIFDILDRNFEELGNHVTGPMENNNSRGWNSGGGGGRRRKGREIGYNDVKLCFVAFVAVFSLPSEPVFAGVTHLDGNGNSTEELGTDPSLPEREITETLEKTQINGGDSIPKKKEMILPSVPLSVAFALWKKVLKIPDREKDNTNELSYIRSTLVLLGFLELSTIEREDTTTAVTNKFESRSIECLKVHDEIHQQYGEYNAWGDHGASYKSLIESHEQYWNEAALRACHEIGSNSYTLRMLPFNTMRARHMQDTFDLLQDKTFVRRRVRVLGASGAATAHVGDIDELLRLIEERMEDEVDMEPIDEQEGLLNAYQQVKKYCTHVITELTKHLTDGEGENGELSGIAELSKAALAKIADTGDAMHLFGASLGGYGFFEEEMEFYREALRLKELSAKGNISKSVPASDTLHCMGFSMDNIGNKDKALEYYDRALDIRLECLGSDHICVAETLHNKGALLCEADRSDEAMSCLEEALRIRELHYGEEHECCADTMQWMGNLLRKHGDPTEALDYFKFALRIKQARLGSDDIDVANTLFNTAVLLDDIEKYELSLIAYKEALRIRKLVLGEENEEVADTLFCMGNVATVIESHEEALSYFKESVMIREALIKKEDPLSDEVDDTLLFISNPCTSRPDLLLHFQKLNQCFEEALPLTKLKVGPNHSDVCDLLNRMGGIYEKLHDWDNAIGSFQGSLRAKRADKADDDDDDIEVAALLQRKGECHLYKNEFSRAKSVFESALKIKEKLLGRISLPVASCTYCLGVAYFYLDDYTHARLLFEECMRIQIEVVGDNDPLVARSLCWLGRQHEKLNESNKTLEKYLSALRIYKRNKSSTDYRVVVMLLHAIGKTYEDDKVNLADLSLKCYIEEINIIQSRLDAEETETSNLLSDAHFSAGLLYKKKQDLDESIDHLEIALKMAKTCDGEESSRVAAISDHLGMMYASRDEFETSKIHLSAAYTIYEQTAGRDHLKTSECAFRLAEVLETLESNLSLDFYKESLRVRKLNIDEDDETVAEILFCLGRVYLERTLYQDAVKCFEQSLAIRKSLLGDCSAVADTYHKLGDTYFQSEQHEKALIFFGESVRINKKLGEKNALYKASFDMAHCCDESGNFKLAIECFTDCLRTTEALEDDMNTALVMQRMGEIHMIELNNYADATKIFLDALELLRGLNDTSDEEEGIIAGLVFQAAQSFGLDKEYETALDYYEEHINMVESGPIENEELVADSMFEMGKIFAKMEDFDLSIEKLKECLDVKKKVLGHDDEQVAHVVFTLANVYEKAGSPEKCMEYLSMALRTFKMKRKKAESAKVYYALARLKGFKAIKLVSSEDYAAAVECYDQGLKLRRQVMSSDDIELSSMLFDYSTLLCSRNEYKTALPLLEEALRIQKTKLGLKDVRVAKTLLRIAEVHSDQEKYDASLVCLEQVLFIESSLDEDNGIDLGLCHYLLGVTYLEKNAFEKSISSFLRSMEIKKLMFGPSSVECAAVQNNLGKAYGKIHEFDKAIECLVEALRIRKVKLGNDSLDYGHSVFNLAEIHIAMEKFAQALNCLNEAVRVYEMFPQDGSLFLDALSMKGDTLFHLKDYELSVSSFQDAIKLCLNSSDSCEESIATLQYKLGNSLSKMNEYDEAFDAYRESIKIFSDALGPNHMRVGDVMYDVGALVYGHGDDDAGEKSMECFKEVMRIYSFHGEQNHTKVADALVQMGSIHTDQADYDEAIDFLDKALNIYEEKSSNDACQIGKGLALQQVGRIHYAKEELDEAMVSFAEALRIFKQSLGENDMNVSLALSNIGIVHARRLEYAEAVEMCTKALKVRKMHFDDDQDVADSLFNIGNILDDWGKKDEAFKFFEKALALYKTLSGDNDLSVANCQQRIGSIYWTRKDVDNALNAFLDALDICEDGHDDIEDILLSVHKGLGDCYYQKEEYDLSLQNFAECLKIQKTDCGDDSIELAATCGSIGMIYLKQEKYTESIDFHTKALQIYEQHHGKGSKESVSSSLHIAKVLLALEKYDLCIELLKDCLKAYCKDGDEDKEEVAAMYHELGISHKEVEDYEESITSLKKALDIRIKLFGTCDLKVANTMLDFGRVLEKWRDSEEAIAIYDQVITIFQKIPESDFRTVAETYTRVGELLEEKGNFDSSLYSFKKALKIYSKNCGSDDVVVGKTLHRLGKIYDQLGEIDKSIACFSEAIKIFRVKLGNDDISVSQSLMCLGKNYARKKQYAKAVELCTESLRIQKEDSEENRGDIAGSLTNIGNILNEWGKTDQALRFYEEALREYDQTEEPDDEEVANCQQNIGVLHKRLGDFETALGCFGKALRGHRSIHGDKSLSVATDLYHMGMIYDSFGDVEKALQCFQECLKIRKKELGDDHLDVLAARRFVATLQRKQRY